MATTVPTGTWAADAIHSSIGFGINHGGVSTFRTTFGDYDVALRDGTLEGMVQVSSIAIALEDFKNHLLSPDFFDVERTPTLGFRSTSLEIADDGSATLAGDLTIKGTTRPVTATGSATGPFPGVDGKQHIGLELTTTVNRWDFGIEFDMKLPDGRPAIGDEVSIEIALELVEQ